MCKIFLKILFVFLTSTSILQAQQQVVFLFDNSGSMSGYYRLPTSSFKLFCNALIKNSTQPGDKVDVLLFSKTEQARGMKSPISIFSGLASEINYSTLDEKMIMYRAEDGLLGNTDLIESLDSGIAHLKGKTGVIWMITDNINDVSGTGDESFQNTLDFYKRLRGDENIRKILMYPIPEKFVEGNKTSEGYVVYGMVYSATPLSQLQLESYDAQLRASGIKQKAITLKPLDVGTIVLKPVKTQSMVSPGKLYFDGKTLRGFDFEEGQEIKEVFSDLVLKSNLYPYLVRSANLRVRLDDFISSDYSVESLGTQTITPSTVSNVSPEGEVTGFSILFNMPEITPVFSFNTIFKEEFTVGGNLILEVYNADIEIDESYINQFQQLFALGSVPDIFQPVIKDKTIYTVIPLEIKIRYGAWRLYILIGLIAVALLLIAAILFILLKRKCFVLRVDSMENSVCLNLINSYNVYSEDSTELGKLKKSFTGDISFKYSKFTSEAGKNVKLNYDLPVEVTSESLDGEIHKSTITISDTQLSQESEYQNSSSELY